MLSQDLEAFLPFWRNVALHHPLHLIVISNERSLSFVSLVKRDVDIAVLVDVRVFLIAHQALILIQIAFPRVLDSVVFVMVHF